MLKYRETIALWERVALRAVFPKPRKTAHMLVAWEFRCAGLGTVQTRLEHALLLRKCYTTVYT